MRTAAAALAVLLTLLAVAGGCARDRGPAPGASNLSLRDAKGTEVARGHLALPARLPGPGRTFTGAFRLVSARGDFPADATSGRGRYSGFVGEGGSTVSLNLNPTVADNSVTLDGRLDGDEVRGPWALSTFGGAVPRGTFVLDWPRGR